MSIGTYGHLRYLSALNIFTMTKMAINGFKKVFEKSLNGLNDFKLLKKATQNNFWPDEPHRCNQNLQ